MFPNVGFDKFDEVKILMIIIKVSLYPVNLGMLRIMTLLITKDNNNIDLYILI